MVWRIPEEIEGSVNGYGFIIELDQEGIVEYLQDTYSYEGGINLDDLRDYLVEIAWDAAEDLLSVQIDDFVEKIVDKNPQMEILND